MKQFSKRLKNLQSKVNFLQYSYKDAIKLIKDLANAKFKESLEAHIALNIKAKQSEQHIRANVILPYGIKSAKKLAVITDNITDALAWGADLAGTSEIFKQISQKQINFDLLIASPEYLPKLSEFGKILGPKGLMPSLKAGTISNNLEELIKDFKLGKKIQYRTDKSGIIHIIFGKSDFFTQHLEENLISIYQSIEKNKPIGVKGKIFKSFYICSTMSPSLKLDLGSFK